MINISPSTILQLLFTYSCLFYLISPIHTNLDVYKLLVTLDRFRNWTSMLYTSQY